MKDAASTSATAGVVATALIAEDEPLLAAELQAELARQWPQLQVLASVGDGQAAVDHALRHRPDVLFLDIRMPGQSGLEAAQVLAEEWPGDRPLPLIVFVTAYDQYALQAFEQSAVDYLLKPLQVDRLGVTCTRLQGTLRQRRLPGASVDPALATTLEQLRSLLSATGLAGQPAPGASAPRLQVIQAGGAAGAIHMVPVAEVLYFEAADKYVRVITADHEHLIRISLRELLPQLDPQQFWQVHRGLVVRADAIRTAVREESGKVTLTLRGVKHKLAASRLYAPLFKAM